MRFFEMLNRALESWFLRIYARNLNKSYRNEPENACSDAEIQLSTMLLMVIGVVFLILGVSFFPIYLGKFLGGGDAMYIAAIAMALAVVFWVHRRFGGYVLKAELARQYISVRNSRRSLTVYWSIIVGSLFIIWVVLWRRQP